MKSKIEKLRLYGAVWCSIWAASSVAEAASMELGCPIVKTSTRGDYVKLVKSQKPSEIIKREASAKEQVRYMATMFGWTIEEHEHYIHIKKDSKKRQCYSWQEAMDMFLKYRS